MGPLGVVIAVTGPLEIEVVQEVDAAPDLEVVRRCADLAEAVAVARAGLGDVLVVSAQARLDRENVHAVRSAGVSVIGVAVEARDAEALRALGIDVAASDLPHAIREAGRGDVRAATPVAPVPAPAAPGAGAGGGRIIAVLGTHGAPGRTTVAVNLAAELALAGEQVLLVDLDAVAASIAAVLGLSDESAGIAALAHGAVRGSDSGPLIDRHAVVIAPHLRVITGMAHASRWAELSDPALEALWPAMRAAADIVVIDTAAPVGGERDTAVTAAAAEADALVMVGSAEPPQVARLVRAAADLPRAAHVVVNRVRASVAGPRPEEAIAGVLARHTSLRELWPLPWDPHACDDALREGRTLAESAPRSGLRRAIQALAGAVLADARAASPAAGLAVSD